MKKAQTDASALLEKNKNIKGLYGCSNTSTIGIAKTLVKEKRTDIVMVGFDMAKETQQFIQDADYQGVSLLQKQDQMGYLGIHSLVSLIKGKNQNKNFLIPGLLWLIHIILWRKVFHEKSKKEQEKERGIAGSLSDSMSGNYYVRLFSF